MAENHREWEWQVSSLHGDIGVAQPAGPDSDPHIVGAHRSRRELDNVNWRTRLIDHRSFHLDPPD